MSLAERQSPDPKRRLAVVSAGLSQPSSTRLLADRLADATVAPAAPSEGIDVEVEHGRAARRRPGRHQQPAHRIPEPAARGGHREGHRRPTASSPSRRSSPRATAACSSRSSTCSTRTRSPACPCSSARPAAPRGTRSPSTTRCARCSPTCTRSSCRPPSTPPRATGAAGRMPAAARCRPDRARGGRARRARGGQRALRPGARSVRPARRVQPGGRLRRAVAALPGLREPVAGQPDRSSSLDRAVGPARLRRRYSALTAPSTFVSESFASPNSSVVFGS